MKNLGWKMTLLLVLGGILFLWLIKAPIMGSYLSSKLKVPVSVGRISIWPSETSIHNFKIKNPRGFKSKTAFLAEETHIEYKLSNLMTNPSEIEEVALKDIFLSIEFSNPLGTQNNWTAIGANIPEKEESQAGREVIIHRLILDNLMVQVRGLGLTGAPQTTRVARIELREINSKNGFPTRELINAIFNQAGFQQYIQDAFNPQKVLQKYLNPFGFFWEESTGRVLLD